MPFLLSALPTPFSSFLLSFILYPGFLLFLPSILISSIPPPRLDFLLIFDISFLFPSTPAIFPPFFYESFCTRSSLFSNLSSISPPFFVFIFIFFPPPSLSHGPSSIPIFNPSLPDFLASSLSSFLSSFYQSFLASSLFSYLSIYILWIFSGQSCSCLKKNTLLYVLV